MHRWRGVLELGTTVRSDLYRTTLIETVRAPIPKPLSRASGGQRASLIRCELLFIGVSDLPDGMKFPQPAYIICAVVVAFPRVRLGVVRRVIESISAQSQA